MSLFTRKHKSSLGDQRVGDKQENGGLSGVLTSSPLSSHFISPIKAPDARRIYQYFVATQIKRYGKTVDLPESATKRHISLALKEYAPVWIIKAIKYSSWISEHPFSVPFALKALADYEAKNESNKHRKNQEMSSVVHDSRLLWD